MKVVYNGTFVVALYFLFKLLCTFAVLCDARYLFIKASLLHQSFLVLSIDWIRTSKRHVISKPFTFFSEKLVSNVEKWCRGWPEHKTQMLNDGDGVCVVKVSIQLDGKTWYCLMLWEQTNKKTKNVGPH